LLAAWSFFAFVLAHFSYIIIALGVDWDGIFVWARGMRFEIDVPIATDYEMMKRETEWTRYGIATSSGIDLHGVDYDKI